MIVDRLSIPRCPPLHQGSQSILICPVVLLRRELTLVCLEGFPNTIRMLMKKVWGNNRHAQYGASAAGLLLN